MAKVITIKVESAQLDGMRNYYKDYIVPNHGAYVNWMAKKNGTTITAFDGKKEAKKITFAGMNPIKEAKMWDPDIKEETKPIIHKEEEGWLSLDTQIGSDEVGVGDFLGPMIVVASYVKKSDIPYLLSIGVRDSKKLTDYQIKEIGQILVKKVDFSKLTLENEKYNEMYEKGENINSLKAKMHNRALANLVKKHKDANEVYVDQFVNENKFYEYLNDKKETKVRNIVFKTKGETSFPSVAISSIIARYSFLLEMEKLNNKYKMEIPFGASQNVNTFATKFIEKYGLKELTKICKMNFANYKVITSTKLF